jgi:hypothetical protein
VHAEAAPLTGRVLLCSGRRESRRCFGDDPHSGFGGFSVVAGSWEQPRGAPGDRVAATVRKPSACGRRPRWLLGRRCSSRPRWLADRRTRPRRRSALAGIEQAPTPPSARNRVRPRVALDALTVYTAEMLEIGEERGFTWLVRLALL